MPRAPQATPVLTDHTKVKRTKSKTQHTGVDVLHYEELLAAEFERRGWLVAQWPTGKQKLGYVPGSGCIVRQYHLALTDPLAPTSPASHFHLDFALPYLKLNLEFDGFRGYRNNGHVPGGHNSWVGFHRDRRRDRLMELAGWHVLRFGPMDLNSLDGVKNAVDVFELLVACIRGKEAA